MKKKLFLLEMLGKAMVIAVLAFGLALSGCATKGGSGTPPAPETLAERLAADLNAIKAGSATAEDATIRLTGDVNLTVRFTVPGSFTLEVPAGITLDLTADGAEFWLQDGATLTVNGTVNASGHGDHGKGWIEGGLRIGEGTAVINGSGTINLKSKGSLLNIDGKRHLTLDGVTLVGIKDNDRSLVNVDNGGEFVLKSGAITSNTYIGDRWAPGAGVSVNKGTFTMEGGKISGNSATSSTEGGAAGGGGVGILEKSVFTMTGGEISGNTTSLSFGGAGLFVAGNNGATFSKTGGIIYGDSDNIHTPGSTENTVTLNGDRGHAVWLYPLRGSGIPNQLRKATAGESVNMSWDGSTAVGFDGTSNAG